MHIVLIGNKTDAEAERQVSTEKGQELAKKHKIMFLETSAKTGSNVDNIFQESSKDIYDNILKGEYDLTDESLGIKPGNDPSKKNSRK